MRIDIDMSEVRTLAADMAQVDSRLTRRVKPVIRRGAQNIKNQLVDEMRSSRHFRGVAPGISYDLTDDGYTAEIGPTKGQPGSLANVAYFGTSRGGGTVRNPEYALAEEVPGFQQALGDLAAELTLG